MIRTKNKRTPAFQSLKLKLNHLKKTIDNLKKKNWRKKLVKSLTIKKSSRGGAILLTLLTVLLLVSTTTNFFLLLHFDRGCSGLLSPENQPLEASKIMKAEADLNSTAQSTITPTPTRTKTRFSWSKDSVIQAVARYLDIPENSFVLDITNSVYKENQYYLTGGVGEENVIGGYYLYAIVSQTKEGNIQTKIVYLGKDQPRCSELKSFSPPIDWLTTCTKD